MRIIGLNSDLEANRKKVNGGSVALIENGRIVMAVAEDRISRQKYMGGFEHALPYVLQYNGLDISDIDYFCISFYGNQIIPHDWIIEHHIRDLGLGNQRHKVVIVPSHHYSHAAEAYFLSPFEEAIIIVADNEGSILSATDSATKGAQGACCERNSYYIARGNCITLLERDFISPKTVAFGKAYNKFTRYIGFGDYNNAGKTMGLSAYGKLPVGLEDCDLWQIDDDGHLHSNMTESYDAFVDIVNFFAQSGVQVCNSDDEKRYLQQGFMDLAYFIQQQLVKWSVEKVRSLIQRTGIRNVCIAGGVALNGIMNAEIERQLEVKVFVPPFPNDQGQALGNALWAYIDRSGYNNNPSIQKQLFSDFIYCGSKFSSYDILSHLRNVCHEDDFNVYRASDVICETAKLLANDNVIGWFQGKSEYGARALGNRSILSTPCSEHIRNRVNLLKGRELFRPLAPSVLAEHVADYFEITGNSLLNPYMLGIVQAKTHSAHRICGVVHVDGSSRLQSVDRESNSRYYDLITAFYKLTDIPMLLNTSFNKAGEPIVETPADAWNTFTKMELDALVCEDIIVTHKTQSTLS